MTNSSKDHIVSSGQNDPDAVLPLEQRPYRACIGLIVFNKDKKIFVGERFDIKNAWQVPQGGVDANEDLLLAGLRELAEETGITNVKPIAMTKEWYKYDFPDKGYVPGHSQKYRGQAQKWLAVLFQGSDSDIKLDLHHEIEFAQWRWDDLTNIPNMIVDFKRPNYEAAVRAFTPYLKGATLDAEILDLF
jgi:putative (di)nucleoside polyphosphate hydrolase